MFASESAVEFVACCGCPFPAECGVVFADVAGPVCREYPGVLSPFTNRDEVVPLHRVVECCRFAAEPADGTCPYRPP